MVNQVKLLSVLKKPIDYAQTSRIPSIMADDCTQAKAPFIWRKVVPGKRVYLPAKPTLAAFIWEKS